MLLKLVPHRGLYSRACGAGLFCRDLPLGAPRQAAPLAHFILTLLFPSGSSPQATCLSLHLLLQGSDPSWLVVARTAGSLHFLNFVLFWLWPISVGSARSRCSFSFSGSIQCLVQSALALPLVFHPPVGGDSAFRSFTFVFLFGFCTAASWCTHLECSP